MTLLITDGCVHLLYNSSWKILQHAAGQLRSGQPVRYGKGRRFGLSITYKIRPAGSLSSCQPSGQPCWASPLDFALIGFSQREGKQREEELAGAHNRYLTGEGASLYVTVDVSWQEV